VQMSHLGQTIDNLIHTRPLETGRVIRRFWMQVGSRVLEHEISINLRGKTPVSGMHSKFHDKTPDPITNSQQHTIEKQSRSKTRAWNNWPKANGCNIQLPHHDGLARFRSAFPLIPLSHPHIMPPSSAAFQPNSSARNAV
jgi:hypothetical protein